MKSNKALATEILKWIHEDDYETYSISIGQDRNSRSYAIAEELADTWQNTLTWSRVAGGFIIQHVDWPETAASWLAQAKALNRDRPDALVIIGSVSSSAAVLKRLADQNNWSAARTFCLLIDVKNVAEHAGDLLLYNGLKGITNEGLRWTISNGALLLSTTINDRK